MKNIRVYVLFLLVLVLSFSSLCLCEVNAASKSVYDNSLNPVDYAAVFDADYYYAKYTNVFIGKPSKEALLNHFISVGMNAGLQGNAEFNVYYYMETYKDLKDVYGTDLKKYYMHYMLVGKAEGRRGSDDYSISLKKNKSEITVGSIVTFGSYEQDGNKQNGKEPIEWFVLDVRDGKALLLSKDILDVHVLYTEQQSSKIVTWKNSELRRWLNNEFKNEAFTVLEQNSIPISYIQNTDSIAFYNNYSDGYGYNYAAYCEDTYDQVFALSYQEVIKYCQVTKLTGNYWGYASPILLGKVSNNLVKSGIFYNYVISQQEYNELASSNYPISCLGKEMGYSWWLRSPGTRLFTPENSKYNKYTSYAIEVNKYGYIGGNRTNSCAHYLYGDNATFDGVRPAIYVTL